MGIGVGQGVDRGASETEVGVNVDGKMVAKRGVGVTVNMGVLTAASVAGAKVRVGNIRVTEAG
jgi:hypothetical protein